MSLQDDFDRQADELAAAVAALRAIARSGKPPSEREILTMLARAASHEQWIRTFIDGMMDRIQEPSASDLTHILQVSR